MTQPNPTPTSGDPTPTPAPNPTPAPPTPAPSDPPNPPDDKPLGPAGEKALAAEREARKALEKQLAELAPLKQIAELLGGKPTGDPKTDLEKLNERFDGYEAELARERQARWRAEVAAEKGLPAALAARLQGATRDELAADADALQALIPATPAKPGTPAPDPSQGSRGTGPADLDAQIREAQSKGDWKTVISLQNQKLATK